MKAKIIIAIAAATAVVFLALKSPGYRLSEPGRLVDYRRGGQTLSQGLYAVRLEPLFPQSCANTKIVVPPKYAEYLWGWPQQFAARAQQHGSSVYLWMQCLPVDKASPIQAGIQFARSKRGADYR